jgi:hypothetical protein
MMKGTAAARVEGVGDEAYEAPIRKRLQEWRRSC